MFTMFRDCNNECVYNLIEKPQEVPAPGPPLYRSLWSCKVREDAFCAKTGCYRTMGIPRVCQCPPENYLKKHSRADITIRAPAVPKVQMCCQPTQTGEEGQDSPCEPSVGPGGDCNPQPVCCQPEKCRIARFCSCAGLCPKPPVQPWCYPFDKIDKGCVDYIRENVKKAIRSVPRKPALKYVDDRVGTTRNWCSSGLPRTYVNNENFGKVPCYIEGYKEELYKQDQMDKYIMMEKEREMREKCRHLDPTERQAIVCGLKKNWEEVFAEYQAMPLNIDTPGKVIKKTELEEKLKDLEKDIQMVERHDHVFVADTCRSFYLA